MMARERSSLRPNRFVSVSRSRPTPEMSITEPIASWRIGPGWVRENWFIACEKTRAPRPTRLPFARAPTRGLPPRTQPFPLGARMDAHARARQLIDDAHSADPVRAGDGRAAELVYADRVEAWVARLVPAAPPLLRLAARSQHLERWSVPRASFPEGKAAYLAWRRSLYTKQAERARTLLLAAGVSAAEAAEVAIWVSKTGLKTNAGTQALEDAACLVFLENEISAFAAQHAHYPREKFVEILRKTWRKMSPAAQTFALALELPPTVAALVRDALGTP